MKLHPLLTVAAVYDRRLVPPLHFGFVFASFHAKTPHFHHQKPSGTHQNGWFLQNEPNSYFCLMISQPTISAFFSWVRLAKTPSFWKVPCQPSRASCSVRLSPAHPPPRPLSNIKQPSPLYHRRPAASSTNINFRYSPTYSAWCSCASVKRRPSFPYARYSHGALPPCRSPQSPPRRGTRGGWPASAPTSWCSVGLLAWFTTSYVAFTELSPAHPVGWCSVGSRAAGSGETQFREAESQRPSRAGASECNRVRRSRVQHWLHETPSRRESKRRMPYSRGNSPRRF